MSSQFSQKSVLSMGSDDVLLKEIDICVDVWTKQCGKALLNGSMDDYYMQKNQISTIQEWRRRIMADTKHKFSGARESAIKLIEAQRQLDESFSIPRLDDGEIVTSDMGLSIHHLLRLHRFMQERLVEGAYLPSTAKEQIRNEQKMERKIKTDIKEQSARAGPTHLLMEMQMAMFKINEPYSMYFSIWTPEDGFVTEEFVVCQTELGLPEDKNLMGRLYTIFTDVIEKNFLSRGYLVVKIYRHGSLVETDKTSPTSTKYKRPFACGAIKLKNIENQMIGESNELSECQIYRHKGDKIETSFSQTHKHIINENFSEIEEIPLSKGIKFCLTLVQGAIENFKDDRFLEMEYGDEVLREKLRDACVTRHLQSEGMVVDEGQNRECGSKSAAKNIEISACLVNNSDGSVVTNCISRGIGKQSLLKSWYSSAVYYHNNNPVVDETFCIDISAVPNVLQCHLFIAVAHCSTNTKEKSTKSLFGAKDKKARDYFAFCAFPLCASGTGLVVPDGSVTLECLNPLSSMNLDDLGASVATPEQVASYLKENSGNKARTLKNGSLEGVSLTTHVHSAKYVQVKAVSDLMNWECCPSDDALVDIIGACDGLPEDMLMPCVQECIATTISIIHQRGRTNELVGKAAFKLFVKAMSIMSERLNDPSKASTSFLQLPTPVGRGEKVHKRSSQERNHQKTKKMMLDSFIKKTFQDQKDAEVLLLHLCAGALDSLLEQAKKKGFFPGMYESALVSTVKDTILIAHYNFQRSRQSEASVSPSSFSLELKSIIFALNQILVSAGKDGRVMMEIRQHFFSILSISEIYLSVSDCSNAAKQYIVAVQNPAMLKSKAAHNDKMKFSRQIMEANVFLEEEGRRVLLPTLVTVLVENLLAKKDLDGTLEVMQLVLEQVEILGTPAEYVEVLPLLPPLVSIMLDQCNRLVNQAGGNVKKRRETIRRMSCLGNTASVTTNSVRINMENATCCLCSLLNLLDKENVLKVVNGDVFLTPKMRVTSMPVISKQIQPPTLTTSKSMRVVELDGDSLEEEGISEQKKKELGKDFVISLLTIQTVVVKYLVIPAPWLLLNMMVLQTFRDSILWFAEVVVNSSTDLLGNLKSEWKPMAPVFSEVPLLYTSCGSSHINDVKVNNLTLWSALLTASLTIALDEEITLESTEMNPARLAFLQSNHEEDVRLGIVEALSRCWDVLPDLDLRLKFVRMYTIPFLALACSPCAPLSTSGRKLVVDLLHAEFECAGSFPLTASHIYDTVSMTLTHKDSGSSQGNKANQQLSVAMEKRFLPSYQPLVDFVGDFGSIFGSHPVLNCKYALDFATEINELKTLLQVLARYPKTTEYEEERSFAYSKLMEFLSKMNRRDAYVKFAHTLAKEMFNLGNFVEAANAILLHAKLLDWSDEMQEAMDMGEDGIVPLIPAVPTWERKLGLIDTAIDLADKGKAWEQSIDLLKEVEKMYTSVRPNYAELPSNLEAQAKLYGRIVSEERFFPTMFRVSYFGKGFENTTLINKTFIYRGNPLETIMDFSNRIKKKHPDCELLAPKVNPGEEHMSSNKQYLQISKVTSAKPEEMDGLSSSASSHLPKYIRDHLQNNLVSCFYYQRPFRKNKVKSANEFLDLWVEKKFLSTAVSFPGHTRRAEVTSETVIVLNPIEMAVVGLEERNSSLEEECKQMSAMASRTAPQSFTMSLSGTVDAAVNGGIKNYESFITGSYRDENPEIAEDVEANMANKGDLVARLKSCLEEQMKLLEKGISLHSDKCLESMVPLHSHIELTFGKMKVDLKQLLNTEDRMAA